MEPTIQRQAARQCEFIQEKGHGVVVQKATTNAKNTATFNADGDVMVGEVLHLASYHKLAADGTSTVLILNKPTLDQKYRIVRAWAVVRAKRTGGTPDHKINLKKGDGAASESFNAIATELDVETATLAADTVSDFILTDAQNVIESGKSLQATLTVGGVTDTGTAEVEVHVQCVPVRA